MRNVYFATLCVFIFMFTFICTLKYQESSPTAEQGEGGKNGRSGALEALEFWTRSRAYPENDIPQDKYFRAFQSAKVKTREISSLLSAASIWDPIGPLNLQGRTKSVAINPMNPNTVYVGTASGGLWRSYTGGLGGDWHQVKLGHPALGISAIVIDPTDSNTIYLGTGEVYRYQNSMVGLVVRTTRGSYGIGILKTIDGGTTWTKSLDWSYEQQRGIQSLKMNPLNPRTLWAATSEGIYKSTNAGSTWEEMLFGYMTQDIVIHLTDTNKVLCTIGNFYPSVTFYTTDGGTNWSASPLPSYTGKTTLAIYPVNPNVVYASAADSTNGVGALYRTTDFGISWTKLKEYFNTGQLLGVQGWYSHYVAVYPTDSSIIVHNGVGRSKSTNGGITFSGVSSGYSDNHSYAIHPTNPNILYAVNDDGIYRSTNFGSSYTNIGFGLQSGQIYNGFSCSTIDSLLALAQSQDHIPGYRYLGSSTWDHGSAVDEAGWNAITPSNDNIMYSVYRFGQALYKSIDRGESFFYVGGFSSGAWNSPIVVSPSNPNILYVGTTRIYKSIDGAGSWNSGSYLDGNPALSMAVSAMNSDTVYVGMAPQVNRAHIYCTTNGGTLWTNVTGSLPDRYPIDMAVDPTNSKIVYVAFGGFGTGHLYKSTDAGTSWSNITGTLPDAPTTAIAIDPLYPNIVYVGNDIGVYVSTNSGSTWSGFSAGLPDAVIVADLTISPSNRALRVATHGNGIWERKLLNELPETYFDYKALTVNYPVDGTVLNVGLPLSSMKASFRSLSLQAHPDSFDVKYRILLDNTEVFSKTKRILGLVSAENRTVTFDGSYAPIEDGTYIVQAITLASDDNNNNDTVQSTFNIIAPSTVSYWTATKIHSPYTEITSGSPGPSGDDNWMRTEIPFSFTYDNHTYDSVLINTNGWLELGAGTRGFLMGLSTAEQIGSYFTYSLATTDHPTKALGPWWTDLSAAPGQITYKTIGSAPNRTFIVQWKDVPAYCCDAATTTTLNFQVMLHETTNLIEFCYGSVYAGVLSSYYGASIGLKDYAGGDYRFYDVYSQRTGLIVDLNTSLNPLTDWPGQDNCYQITTNPNGISLALTSDWNLISLPVNRSNYSIASIFPTAVSGTLFQYTTSYQTADSIMPGGGYWLKFPASMNQFIIGSEMPSVSVSLNAGWNIIGSVDHEVTAPSGGIITSSVFEFNGSGYSEVSTLKPGKGYWVRASSTGVLTLGPQNEPKPSAKKVEANFTMTITDKLGRKRELSLSENQVNLERYDLPPLPPAEVFDVRFTSQRMLESYPKEINEETLCPIKMQSPVYPLTITYKTQNAGSKGYVIDEMFNDKITGSHNLSGEGKIIINSGDERTLRLRVISGKQIPTHFALMQNYPNPFNPITAISFDLPAKSTVSLKVYDIIGKEVMTLANGEYEAGSYAVQADLTNLASGMYLYRLRVGTFTDVKKMILAK